VFARLRDEYAERYVALASTEVTPRSLLTLLWNVYDDPYLAAVYEVYGAARTDDALRAAIEPMIREHVEIIHQLAHDIVTLMSDADDDAIREMVGVAALSMQGLALSRPAYIDPYGGEQLVDTVGPIVRASHRRWPAFLNPVARLARRTRSVNRRARSPRARPGERSGCPGSEGRSAARRLGRG
jgi:hypothetical protein